MNRADHIHSTMPLKCMHVHITQAIMIVAKIGK